VYPQLTIIGNGPEEPKLRQQAKDLNIDGQIEFAGLKTGLELARILNEHRIMVIPTRCKEGFGIVALEGIACGCVAVGSEGAGLIDAIGPCGVTFPNGNGEELARVLGDLLASPEKLEDLKARASTHLARHKKEDVARAYLEVFRRAVK
jgi:glycosyltransferase involved in cell wall biosynthesis